MTTKVLIIGDSYMSSSWFSEALDALGANLDVSAHQIANVPATWPTDRVREFEGDPAEVAALLDGHEVLIVHGAPVTREVFESAPGLRFIGCARGGPVNIDQEAAADHGVTIALSAGKNADAVAELTIGCAIALLRNFVPAARDLSGDARDGGPGVTSNFDGARWFGKELPGTTLGLVGLGNVARGVARRANALGMRVVAFDPYAPEDPVDGVTRVDSLDALLTQSEVLTIHARATAENRHLIGAAQLAQLPRGAHLINSARESLVDEHALLAALNSGQVGGAALDVFEPDGPWRELALHPRVLELPHIAGATLETLQRGAVMIANALAQHLAAQPEESP